MGSRLNTYPISEHNIRDDGRVLRPFDSELIDATQMSFVKPDGTHIEVVECLPAGETLCPAICSCGVEVECSRITLVLDNSIIAYPASCCNSIQFFEGDEMND
tara:strand:+ start:2150 stop:2458 length:309 start_codon:yes stop_codon:yes gene_type:complete